AAHTSAPPRARSCRGEPRPGAPRARPLRWRRLRAARRRACGTATPARYGDRMDRARPRRRPRSRRTTPSARRGVRSLRSVIDLTAGASSRRERRHLQAVGRPAPLSMDVIAGICAPASQTAAAWSMYVLLGSGALSAFCRSAAQHFLIELPLEPPVFVGVAVADAVGSGGGASGKSSIGAVSVVALAAGGAGRGGGGSSFWHPRGSASAARSGQNRRRDG